MKQNRVVELFGAFTLAALLGAGCGGTTTEPASTTTQGTSEIGARFTPSSRVHKMPYGVRSQSTPINTATSAHLTYYGGKVLQNIQVVAVFWGPSVNSTITSGIGGFFTAVTNSAYFDWLSEYNTTSPAQSIGRGTYYGSVTITPGTTGTSLTDAQIQTELNNQINSGVLPAPTANTWYAIYFPAGVSITQGGSGSCVAGGFCAYHGTFNGTKGEIYYGVMPDMAPGSGCNTGCGSDASWFNNATSVTSHEMIETTTDAEVGLSTVVGAPLAWYDSTNGEIGDICNAQQGSIAGYVVQTEWSNSSNACIVSKTTGGSSCTVTTGLANGGFESGTTGWTLSGTASTNTAGHTGTALQLGATTATNGDSTATQSFTLPSNASTLSFWYKVVCPDSVTYDWATASFTDGSGTTTTVLPNTCNNSGTWVQVSINVASSAGKCVTLKLTSHDDNYASDPTYTLFDDVAINAGGGGGVTNPVQNPGFEAGSLTSWTASGASTSAVSGGHSGTYAAQLGATTATNGDSSISQTFTAPSGSSSLSFWYKIVCPDTVTYDWATATLTDNTSATSTTVLAKTCTNSGSWVQATASVTAGHSYTLTLTSHDDNYASDPTYTLYDDVVVQ